MIHGLYIPGVFKRNNIEYRIAKFNFAPFVEQGGKFVVIEANESFTQHNAYFADAVQAAFDAGIKVVIAKFDIFPPRYYQEYNDPGAWEVNNYDLNDVCLKQIYNALRSGPAAGQGKFIHGVILNFTTTAQASGADLVESWWMKIMKRTLSRVRDHAPWVNRRLTAERVFPMIEQAIIDVKYKSVGEYMYQNEPFTVCTPGYVQGILSGRTYANMFSIFESSTINIDLKLRLSYAKDWAFWKGADLFIDPNFTYENGDAGLVSTCAFNGDEQALYSMFRPTLVVPPVVPPVEPEDPPVVEPEPDVIGEALEDIADGLSIMMDAIDRIIAERQK